MTPRSLPFLAVLLAIAGSTLVLSLLVGTVPVSITDLISVKESEDSLAQMLVMELRLPRALTAFAAGAVLALAGVLMQVLLRNPLADPYVMGVSGGAAIAALGAMLLGLSALAVDIAASLGALGITVLVFALAHHEGSWTPARLLLTGIVVAAGASACVSLLLTLGEETQLRGMLFWLMGDVSLSSPRAAIWIALLAALVVSLPLSRHLNLLARGELQALTLGAPVVGLRIAIFSLSSMLTAVAVTSAGTIGFIGLVTPHLVRLWVGADHRIVLPASAILGGTIVMAADLCARTLFAPRQLPVGALTALIGVPLFLVLMRRQATEPRQPRHLNAGP